MPGPPLATTRSKNSRICSMDDIEKQIKKFQDGHELTEKERKEIMSGTRQISIYGALGSFTGSTLSFYFTKGRPPALRFSSAMFTGIAFFVLGSGIGAYKSVRSFVQLEDSPFALEMRRIIHENRLKGKKIPWAFRDIDLSSSDRVHIEEREFEEKTGFSAYEEEYNEDVKDPFILKEQRQMRPATSWDDARGKQSKSSGSSAWDKIRADSRTLDESTEDKPQNGSEDVDFWHETFDSDE